MSTMKVVTGYPKRCDLPREATPGLTRAAKEAAADLYQLDCGHASLSAMMKYPQGSHSDNREKSERWAEEHLEEMQRLKELGRRIQRDSTVPELGQRSLLVTAVLAGRAGFAPLVVDEYVTQTAIRPSEVSAVVALRQELFATGEDVNPRSMRSVRLYSHNSRAACIEAWNRWVMGSEDCSRITVVGDKPEGWSVTAYPRVLQADRVFSEEPLEEEAISGSCGPGSVEVRSLKSGGVSYVATATVSLFGAPRRRQARRAFRSLNEAHQWLEDAYRKRRQGGTWEGCSLESLFDQWCLADSGECSETSKRTYTTLLSPLMKKYGGYRCESLTRASLTRIVSSSTSKEPAPSPELQRKRLNSFVLLLEYGFEQEVLAHNVAAEMSATRRLTKKKATKETDYEA